VPLSVLRFSIAASVSTALITTPSQRCVNVLTAAPRKICCVAIDEEVPGPFAGKAELDDALHRLQAAAQDNPSDPSAHLNLGTVARRLQQLPVAAASLRRAVELLPDDDDAKRDLGDVLVSMGYVDDAEAVLRDLISRERPAANSRPSRTKIALANLLLDARGQRAEALAVFRDVSTFGPTPIAFLAGVTADSMGDHAAAVGYYENSWSFDPDEDTALHLMLCHLRAGDKPSAAAMRARLPSHVVSSAEYVLSTAVAMQPSMHYFTHGMLQLALKGAPPWEGLVLEFGVYHGKSIRMIAAHFPNDAVHGFDTFSGIPEDWHFTRSGTYSTHGTLPAAPDNVEFHVGLFAETLPSFFDAHPGPISFMNIDCDLYSSTKDVLDATAHRIQPGTIIVFDEYVMNPHWQEDEHKAFQEAVVEHGWRYRYLAISLVSQQAVVQIVE